MGSEDKEARRGGDTDPHGSSHARTTVSTARFEAEIYRDTGTVRVSPVGLKRLRGLSATVAEAVDRAENTPDREGWVRATIPIESIDRGAWELMKLGAEEEVVGPEGFDGADS